MFINIRIVVARNKLTQKWVPKRYDLSHVNVIKDVLEKFKVGEHFFYGRGEGRSTIN